MPSWTSRSQQTAPIMTKEACFSKPLPNGNSYDMIILRAENCMTMLSIITVFQMQSDAVKSTTDRQLVKSERQDRTWADMTKTLLTPSRC